VNDQLKHALKQEDTILFIGSGISCWAGLPSWSGLLLQLADYLEACGGDAAIVRRELKQDLLQAAGYRVRGKAMPCAKPLPAVPVDCMRPVSLNRSL
jgi:hypothetical protein